MLGSRHHFRLQKAHAEGGVLFNPYGIGNAEKLMTFTNRVRTISVFESENIYLLLSDYDFEQSGLHQNTFEAIKELQAVIVFTVFYLLFPV